MGFVKYLYHCIKNYKNMKEKEKFTAIESLKMVNDMFDKIECGKSTFNRVNPIWVVNEEGCIDRHRVDTDISRHIKWQ